ncbi:MAG: hypothetical protein A2W91_19140 [Bacteroidetes bacterium GWF2_38_335]|nr:MAG: hypothetical protein A2W91_19140 [Bacteroidetes bacterium GWF2_38_335]HBS86330.1 hypothetical protein [Bacteroidales bacterium]
MFRIIITLVLFSNCLFSQSDSLDIEIINKDKSGKVLQTKVVRFENKSNYFDFKKLNEKFHIIHYFPDSLLNPKFKDVKTYVTNGNEKLLVDEDFKVLSELRGIGQGYYYYTYDSLSRISRFGYSGCLACAHTPYYCDVFYDESQNPIRISMNMGDFGNVSNIEIQYNENDKLSRIIKISDAKTTEYKMILK